MKISEKGGGLLSSARKVRLHSIDCPFVLSRIQVGLAVIDLSLFVASPAVRTTKVDGPRSQRAIIPNMIKGVMKRAVIGFAKGYPLSFACSYVVLKRVLKSSTDNP